MATAEIRMNQHFEPMGIYALGFLDSAQAIFERADQGRGLVDYALYPGAYCLRHGVELFLKQVTIYVAYIKYDAALLYTPGHVLAETWTAIRAGLEDVLNHIRYDCPRDGVADIDDHVDVIQSVVDELHEFDPDGSLFRYPESVRAPKNKPRERADQPPPFELVNLSDWAASAEAARTSAHAILNLLSDFAGELAPQRGDPSTHFHDTVMRLKDK